ncbi:bis-aminopropyl spermidine synthase family protein [Rhodopseudomonas palustris]|uniref:Putative methyltransferase n=1 Tax=Rhodopseudomonas palustris TaxID=1076 RepID=A0A418VE17_RHOPL|nr:bis-aminopropyl spermidine synthase family protein [Rhodopseudomonas palustris]RJF74342.1 putative methyltransferase [Rhodopseudomonas palustris]
MRSQVDLREAVNAVSDVVQNRPRPLREFDQIHMKIGDMVMQSEIVADWADGKRLAFIGDGDAISVCVAYMKARGVFDFGPSKITVFDFDERTVQSVVRFADRERIEYLDAKLYNCLDAFPTEALKYDCFYTNPPWGASNEGESVKVFVERGIEAVRGIGDGMIVIADDDELAWPKRVLGNVQRFAAESGFFVSRMQRKLHGYHLDDAPNLKSCNLFVTSLPDQNMITSRSNAIEKGRLTNFYGRSQVPRVQYVREIKKPDYGMASEEEYRLELLKENGE